MGQSVQMEKTIELILQGNFDYEKGSLDFSCAKVEISLQPNEVVEGSFEITARGKGTLSGAVYSNQHRMVCLTPEFSGETDTIAYAFDAENMEPGEVIKGEFQVVSSHGEFYLPYVVSVLHPVLESSMGEIRNLFHFTNLAKANWEEAVKLFYHPAFSRVLTGNDKQYEKVYAGLSECPGNEYNVEEFLQEVKKKQKIEFLIEEKEIRLEDVSTVSQTKLTILRNGWGHTCIQISCNGDFLSCQSEQITDDAFLGNVCHLPIDIEPEFLHGGHNYGEIILETAYDTMCVPVHVIQNSRPTYRSTNVREKKHLVLHLMEFYQAFRMKKISSKTWMHKTGEIIDRMVTMDDKDLPARLFQAQLLISQERYNEAQWLIEQVDTLWEAKKEKNPVLWAYYLYLTTLINREEAYTDTITREVEEIYRYYPGEWRIAWLLLYLSEEYNKSVSRKWLFIEEQFEKGCTSPIIYIEALLLASMNPSLIRKADAFEIQVLYYAAKNEVLTKEIMEQFAFLVPKMRQYSETVVKILEACYKVMPNRDVLYAICTMLMKGNKTGTAYFPWYELAVQQEIRITRLYEYYMMSIDLHYKGPIHKMVLMYFSYHSTLDYERNAFLYANVHQYQTEFQELYLTYLPKIEKFLLEQIEKGHINHDLAYLYKHMFSSHMVNETIANQMAPLLFTHLIRVQRDDISKVLIYFPQKSVELCYPIIEKKALIPVYGRDYTIIMETTRGNRLVGSNGCTLEKLMIPGKIVKLIAPYVIGNVDFDLYYCKSNGDIDYIIDEENLERYFNLATSPCLNKQERNRLQLQMVKYLYEEDLLGELDSFLQIISPDIMERKQRNEVFHYLVLRGFHEQGMTWIERFGLNGMDAGSVLELANVLLEEKATEDAFLSKLVVYAFRNGKYSSSSLNYLVSYFNGNTREMRDIWKACIKKGVDSIPLLERMLVQMLFSGSFVGEKMEIFKTYTEGEANLLVEKAFLYQAAYDFFVKERLMGNFVFDEMLRLVDLGEELPRVCKLAILKHFAENSENRSESVDIRLKELLEEMLLEKIYFPYYEVYEDLLPILSLWAEKTMIEYRAAPGSSAVLHYVIQKAQEDEGEYITEVMRDVYGGVCIKEFTLFFGEKLQYYIVEMKDEIEQLTESDTVQKSDIMKQIENSKFHMVNDMVISQYLQEYDTAQELVMECLRTEYMTEHLFHTV